MQLELENVVEAFERARTSSADVDLRDYLPGRGHPQYTDIVVELIRADLEFSYQESRPRSLANYLEEFPDVRRDHHALAQVAFEEYRLSVKAGVHRSPREYAQQYQIDTSAWPSWSGSCLDDPVAAAQDELNSTIPSEEFPSAAGGFPDVGAKLGDFELIDELGRGAFGRVFLARQGELADRPVALKVTIEPNAEPQRLAELQHTNIVPIYSLHQVGSLQAVCMPFSGSATLADVRRRLWRAGSRPTSGRELISAVLDQRASVAADAQGVIAATVEPSVTRDLLAEMSYQDAVAWIAARVADGLAHAHERGVIHRDLKPANILVSDDGLPLILDFHLSVLATNRGTDAAMVGGTLPYMAPEHIETIRSGGTVDLTSDIYALGVILFELLTGRSPFPLRRGSLEQVVSQMLADRARPARSIRQDNPQVSPDLAAITAHCLQADCRQRYSSARQLQTDLERHLKDLPPRYAPGYSVRERARKWIRRHPRVASGTTIAICISVVLAALVTGLVARSHQLARAAARDTVRQFSGNLATARAPLASVQVDFGSLTQAIEDGRELLAGHGASNSDRWQNEPPWTLLDAAAQQRYEEQIAELRYLVAAGCIRAAERVDAPLESARFLDEAESLIQLAAGHFPSTPRALLLLHARLAARRGQAETAQSLRDQAEETELPTQFERYLQALSVRSNDVDEALLEQLMEESSDSALLWLVRGNLQQSKRRLDLAEASYTASIAVAPDMLWARFFRGNVRFMDHRFGEAQEDFDAVLRQRVDWPPALFGRSLALQAQGEIEAAVADMTSAIEHGATETRIYFKLSQLLRQQGDLIGARRARALGLKLTPTDFASWMARGVQQLSSSPVKALQDFQRAASLKPASPEPWMNIASAYAKKLEDDRKAVEAMDQVIALSPPSPKALATRGVLLARLGRREEAHRDAHQALELDQRANTAYRVSGIFAQTSQLEEGDAGVALRLLKQAAAQDPPLVLHYLAVDPDWEPLRANPQFRELVRRLADLQSPPAGDEQDGESVYPREDV